jgi:molybdopterin converting factor small subunit
VRCNFIVIRQQHFKKVALDQELAGFDAPLAGVREVAFFPPMTGG